MGNYNNTDEVNIANKLTVIFLYDDIEHHPNRCVMPGCNNPMYKKDSVDSVVCKWHWSRLEK